MVLTASLHGCNQSGSHHWMCCVSMYVVLRGSLGVVLMASMVNVVFKASLGEVLSR